MKKLPLENKNSGHKKLINALWADKDTIKKSIGMSTFQIMYGIDVFSQLLWNSSVKTSKRSPSGDQ